MEEPQVETNLIILPFNEEPVDYYLFNYLSVFDSHRETDDNLYGTIEMNDCKVEFLFGKFDFKYTSFIPNFVHLYFNNHILDLPFEFVYIEETTPIRMKRTPTNIIHHSRKRTVYYNKEKLIDHRYPVFTKEPKMIKRWDFRIKNFKNIKSKIRKFD